MLIKKDMPQLLDDVIRERRDDARLYLTTDPEVFNLHAAINPSRQAEIMDDWRFISLHLANSDTTLVFLLGIIRSKMRVRITSDVRKIDLDRNLVITNSGSLYQLGTKGEGEPRKDGFLMICSAFHAWGFGTVFGVPHFLYHYR